MDSVKCTICELGCRLSEDQTGGCGLYQRMGDLVVERYPDRYLVACPISIETVPMLHFHPGGKFFQITTTGCNFNCPGCISTVLVREMPSDSPALMRLSPEEVVAKAMENQCEGIVFLMNDPIASFPSFLKVAKLARDKNLKVGCSSNTYFTSDALKKLIPYLDFINVGMKGFTDKAYRACGVPGVGPVLRNLRILHRAGVHIEVSCILTRNNASELMDLARHIAGISRRIPLQVMRFLPFESASIAQEPTIREAEDFCSNLRLILDFVYLFNTPGTELLNTDCPGCKETILTRDFYGPMGAKVRIPPQGLSEVDPCPLCGCNLSVVGPSARLSHQEKDFEGGYPLTRALEIVEAILIALGITQKEVVAKAWEDVLQDGGLAKLHQNIQHPRRYIQAVREFGEKAGAKDQAEVLARYLEERLRWIEDVAKSATQRPRVYYAMGKPLFYLSGNRLENQLVETAGGVSVNRELPAGGRPGHTLRVSELNRLNPDTIFISAFISNSVADFYAECLDCDIQVEAMTRGRIFVHPYPGWDFGSPRWILGLMHMASIFHPDQFLFDVLSEAKYFYRFFYEMDFSPSAVNRSFAKPSNTWAWK